MSLNPSPGRLHAWFTLKPPPKFREWKTLERNAYCSALERKMRSLRFRKVFGFDSGGRTNFVKRITNFGQIADNWRRLARIPMESLDRERIPDSPPVPVPIASLRPDLQEQIWWELVKQARRGTLRCSHLAFGLTTKEKAAGHRWSINFGIFWHLDPDDVLPPSKFWASLLIWPPSGFTQENRKALEKMGFHSRISRSLRKRNFKGRWHAYGGGWADFSRHRLRWKEVESLCDEFQKWTVNGALAEIPTKGRPERFLPTRYYRS